MEECELKADNIACLRGDRLLFAGLSCALKSGDILQVTGPNGTGKSSLIRILAGLMRPFSGSLQHKGEVALVDESLALDEQLPLGKALSFWSAIDAHSGEHWERLGLSDLLDVPVQYLSTGQRKRAALARLIGQNAAIWMLDEPLNGLDKKAVALVHELVGEHRQNGGISIIASHQDLALAGIKTIAISDFPA